MKRLILKWERQIKTLIFMTLTYLFLFSLMGGCGGPAGSDEETYPLHSMGVRGEASSSGSFFLIAGGYSKSEGTKYYYYAENPDGTLQLHRNSYEDVVIKLIKDDSSPRIECKGDYTDKGDQLTMPGWGMRDECIFMVPENSIGSDVKIKISDIK